MRIASGIVLLAFMAACDGRVTDPCLERAAGPVLEIASAGDARTGATASNVLLTGLMLNGGPVDGLRTDFAWNIERVPDGLACTLPCRLGREPGTYEFEVHAAGFYQLAARFEANHGDVPVGCDASHGDPTTVSLAMTEADSARVTFSFVRGSGTGLSANIATVTFDDGAGERAIDLAWPWESHITRNTGTLNVRFVIGAPDTIAAGSIELPLQKDWDWGVSAHVGTRNPARDSFCTEATSFPLRRPVAGADSMWIGWSGLPLSISAAC